MAFAIAAGSQGGTSSACSMSFAISGIPPTLVATTGTPAAMASNSTFGEPSLSDEITIKSAIS